MTSFYKRFLDRNLLYALAVLAPALFLLAATYCSACSSCSPWSPPDFPGPGPSHRRRQVPVSPTPSLDAESQYRFTSLRWPATTVCALLPASAAVA